MKWNKKTWGKRNETAIPSLRVGAEQGRAGAVSALGPLQTLWYREAKCYPEPPLPAPLGLEGEDPPPQPTRVSEAMPSLCLVFQGSPWWVYMLHTF